MSALLSKAKDKVSSATPGKNKSRKSPSGSPTGRSIPPEPVQQMPNGDFTQHDAEPAMQVHNLARVNKQCKQLEWSGELAKDAEAYAKKLAERDTMEHSGVQGQGENLYMSSANAELDEAVNSWLSEEQHYHGERVGEGDFGKWGHFSQCLWQKTTHVGMGKATAKSGATYIVARYTPPGNMQGEKPMP